MTQQITPESTMVAPDNAKISMATQPSGVISIIFRFSYYDTFSHIFAEF